MYEIFYEDQDYFDKASTLSLAYTLMAKHFANLKDEDNTVRCLKLALENAKKSDSFYDGMENGAYGITDTWDIPEMPKEKRHTSILANPDFDYPTSTIWVVKDAESQVKQCLKEILHDRFDFVREKIDKIIKL